MTRQQSVINNERSVFRIITDGQSVRETFEPRTGEDLKLVVIFVATGEQRFEIDVTALHRRPRTGTDLVIRGVVFDQAAVTFRGLIDIQQGAKGSKAFLRADALLLGDKAHADLIPSLTIRENEVQAGHGATVQRINEEHLFYLMSRGLPHTKAVELLVRGFLKSVMDDLPRAARRPVERAVSQTYSLRLN